MNHLCPICGRQVDAEGYPVATLEFYSPMDFVVCIEHRKATKERFTTAIKMIHNGDRVTSETKVARPCRQKQ